MLRLKKAKCKDKNPDEKIVKISDQISVNSVCTNLINGTEMIWEDIGLKDIGNSVSFDKFTFPQCTSQAVLLSVEFQDQNKPWCSNRFLDLILKIKAKIKIFLTFIW